MTISTALINDDKDLLTPIHAAENPIELNQLQIPHSVIQSSPYSIPGHALQLDTLEIQYRIVAIVLRALVPVTDRYAFTDYAEAFNFSQVLNVLRSLTNAMDYDFPKTELYIVAFKSTLWPEIRQSSENRSILADVDRASHLEANLSGGLLKYWFGTPDDGTGRNLATCFWRSKEEAKIGGGGKAHREGMRAVKGWFKEWHIEQYRLTISEGAEDLKIIPYIEK